MAAIAVFSCGCGGMGSNKTADGMEAAAVEPAGIPAGGYESWKSFSLKMLSAQSLRISAQDSIADMLIRRRWRAREPKNIGEEVPQSSLKLADSLWISDDISLKPEYQEVCAEDFYTSSYHVDFKAQEDRREDRARGYRSRQRGFLAPEMELSPDRCLLS